MTDQLVERVTGDGLGVNALVDHTVSGFQVVKGGDGDGDGDGTRIHTTVTITNNEGDEKLSCFRAKEVTLATERIVAQRLISTLTSYESLATAPKQIQRLVVYLYYGFNTPPPIDDSIPILNGEGGVEEVGRIMVMGV